MDTVKIVVFVPKTYADVVRQAMGDAGAGRIATMVIVAILWLV